MSYFRDTQEVGSLFSSCFARFLASDEGGRASEISRALPLPAVLELRLTDPEATLCIDLGERRVAPGRSGAAPVRLEIESSALHDLLLDRLDAVQISRLFEEGRAAIDCPAEALAGLLALGGALAGHYPRSLAEQGREDLLRTPAPPRGIVWSADSTAGRLPS